MNSDVERKVRDLGLTSLYSCKLKAKKGKGMTTTYFCAVTEAKLILAKKKGAVKAYSWILITDFVVEASKLTIKFQNKVVLLFLDPIQPLADACRDALCHIRTNSELASFTLSGKMKTIRSGYGAFCRLNEVTATKFLPITPREAELYSDVLLFRKPRLHLVEGATTDSQKMLLDMIELSDCIDELVLASKGKSDIFSTVMSIAKDASGVKYLELKGEVTSGFASFCDYLTNNRQSVISGLGFHDSKLKRSDLEKIRQVALARKMQSLSFDAAIEPDELPYMYSCLFPSMFGSSLMSVSIDNTKIDFDALLDSLPSVRFFSVRNCGLQVNKALKTVSQFRNVHRIDLSENLCESADGLDFSLPDTLKELVIDKIRFSDDVLKTLGLFLFKEMPRRSVLSIRRAKVSVSGWHALIASIIPQEPTKLKGLKWDGNMVTPEFIRYLSRGVITLLSLSGCLTESDVAAVDSLCEWIRNSKTLIEFVCRGRKEKRLNVLHAKVISAISRSSSLTIVDLTGQGGQRECITALQELVHANKGIRRLGIDELHPEDPAQFLKFLRESRETNAVANVAFPEVDLKEMVKSKKLSVEEYHQIMDMFRVEHSNDYIKPFHLCAMNSDESRPFYLTSRALELLTLYPSEASYMKGVRRIPKVFPKKKFVSVFMPRVMDEGENAESNLRNLKSESTHGFDLEPEKKDTAKETEAPVKVTNTRKRKAPPIPLKKESPEKPPANSSAVFKLEISSDSSTDETVGDIVASLKEKKEKKRQCIEMNRKKSFSTERMKTAPVKPVTKSRNKQDLSTSKKVTSKPKISKFASQEGESVESISGVEKAKPARKVTTKPPLRRKVTTANKHGINQKKAVLVEFNSTDETPDEPKKVKNPEPKTRPTQGDPRRSETVAKRKPGPETKETSPIRRYIPARSRKRADEEQKQSEDVPKVNTAGRTPMQIQVKELIANPIGVKKNPRFDARR